MMLIAQALALCHKRKILTYVNSFVVKQVVPMATSWVY